MDAAQYTVKAAEGSLWPSVSLQGNVSRNYDPVDDISKKRVDSASLMGRVDIPIYQGGQASSQIRQTKEALGRRRIELDQVREQVHTTVVTAWGNLEAARALVAASQAAIRANETALASQCAGAPGSGAA